MALKAGLKNGALKQSKGTGASESFRIGLLKIFLAGPSSDFWMP